MTVFRSPDQLRAQRAAKFHAEPMVPELGVEPRIIRVVKSPLGFEVRLYTVAGLREEMADEPAPF